MRRQRRPWSGSDHGNDRDLKLVTEKKWDGDSWETVGVSYYRYHKTGSKGLKYVFGPEAYRRLLIVAADPDALDEGTPADLEKLDEHADAY